MDNYIQAVGNVQGYQLVASTSNTSPIIITSTQLVSNLNSQYLNGQQGSYYTMLSNQQGILNGLQGGTGLGSINQGQVLFGNSNNSFIQTSNLFWNNTTNQLGIGTSNPQYSIDVVGSLNVTQSLLINGVSVNAGLQIVQKGGTGLSNVQSGYVLFGQDSNQLNTSSNLTFNISNQQLVLSSIIISSNFNISTSNLVSNLNVQYLNNQQSSYYTNATNINSGTLSTAYGGTGLNSFFQGQIIFASTSNQLAQTSNIQYDSINSNLKVNQINVTLSTSNTSQAPLIISNSNLVSNLNAQYLNGQSASYYVNVLNIISIQQGGTGLSNVTNGCIPFGQGQKSLGLSSNLFWDSTNLRLGINNIAPQNALDVVGNVYCSSNICFQNQLISSTANGTAPLQITSTTLVSNLNVQYLGGQLSSYYTQYSNMQNVLVNVSNGGTGLTNITQGQILFGSTSTQVSTTSNLFWNTSNFRLGVKNTTPMYELDVTGNIQASCNLITSNQLISLVATGVSPLQLSSTTLVSNLNVQYLNGQLGQYYTNANNIISGILATTYGGTGLQNPVQGQIIFGQSSNALGQSSNLFWDYTNFRLGIRNSNPLYALDVVGNIQASSNIIAYNQIVSLIASGTAPLSVTSTTIVSNLNVQYLNSQQGSFYTNASNISSGILQSSFGGTGLSNPVSGQILFGQSSNSIGQSSNLFWNSSSNFLGINNPTPLNALDIIGNVNIQGSVTIANALIMSNSQTINPGQLIFGGQSNLTSQSSNLYYNSISNYLGIGTSAPNLPLDVESAVTNTYSNYGYLSKGSYGTAQSNYSAATSIYGIGRIVTGVEFEALSDRRLKKNIHLLDTQQQIQFIKQLKPVKFQWNKPNDSKQSIGLIAQDIIKTGINCQELVNIRSNHELIEDQDEENFKSPNKIEYSLNYDGFSPVMISVIQHLLSTIDNITSQNQIFQQKIEKIESLLNI